MANDRSNFFFNVLALENILVALNREIGDGPCFLYIKFSWIGVGRDLSFEWRYFMISGTYLLQT